MRSCFLMAIIILYLTLVQLQEARAGQDSSVNIYPTDTTSIGDKDIHVDNKITPVEKAKYKKAVEESNKQAEDQAKTINNIPGVYVKPDDLKIPPKKHFSLNPVDWLFKPITRLQNQSVRLEQQIMKLTGPIAALQPSMLRLEKRMNSVQKQMGDMQGQIGNLEKRTNTFQNQMITVDQRMQSINKQMSAMQNDITAMRTSVDQIKGPIIELKDPIMGLREPLLRITDPVSAADKRLITVDARLRAVAQELTDLKVLIGLVLSAIFLAAVIIAIGTPIAAIIVWRNRSRILPKPDHEQEREENSLSGLARTLNKQLKH